jgi:hypothetical protein
MKLTGDAKLCLKGNLFGINIIIGIIYATRVQQQKRTGTENIRTLDNWNSFCASYIEITMYAAAPLLHCTENSFDAKTRIDCAANGFSIISFASIYQLKRPIDLDLSRNVSLAMMATDLTIVLAFFIPDLFSPRDVIVRSCDANTAYIT